MGTNCFLEMVQRSSLGYWMKGDYSKGACSKRLLRILGEARVIGMLQASYFDALDTIYLFVGGVADPICNVSGKAIPQLLTSYVEMLSLMVRKKWKAELNRKGGSRSLWRIRMVKARAHDVFSEYPRSRLGMIKYNFWTIFALTWIQWIAYTFSIMDCMRKGIANLKKFTDRHLSVMALQWKKFCKYMSLSKR